MRRLGSSAALFIVVLSVIVPQKLLHAASKPELVSKTEVYRYELSDPYDPKNLYGFNHAPSIALMPDGRLINAWFSGPFEAAVNQVILGNFSSDEGATWSKGQVFQDTPRVSDFDPAFVVDDKRVWMFYSAGRWNKYPSPGPKKGRDEQVGVKSYRLMARYTDDSGATWSEPKQMLEERGHGSRSNGIRLTSGELLLPIYHFEPPYTGSVLKSSDHGQAWKQFGKVSPAGKVGASEPTIVELKSGDILMAVRTTDGHFWTARSRDKGESWSEPEKSEMPANTSSHFLFRLADGRIALTHNPCEPSRREKLTIRISDDDARTWGEPLLLAEVQHPQEGEDTWGRQVTYPSVTQLKNGTLVVTWTWLEMSSDAQWGAIQCARVRVP